MFAGPMMRRSLFSNTCLTVLALTALAPAYCQRTVPEADAWLGQDDAALADFTIAEETHRRAIMNLPGMKKMYSKYLAEILKIHAALLDRMGRISEAAKLRAEAVSL